MNKPLSLVVRIEAKKGKAELLKSELSKLVEPSRKEKGNIYYDVNQDNNKPELFMAYEIWESKELFQAHLDSEHFQACLAATDGAIEVFTENNMTNII